MYRIKNWLNCRFLVPQDELMRIYQEFIEYALSNRGMKQAMPDTVTGHNLSLQKEIFIPSELQQIYMELGRFSPLIRAYRLEKYLNTNCRIYFKREDIMPTGSFKLNAIIAQAFFAKQENRKIIIGETAAGQTGAAIAFASKFFDIPCQIFMVKSSYLSRDVRRSQMQLYDAEVILSPSKETKIGKETIEKFKHDPNYPGNEAVAVAECAEKIFQTPESTTLSGSFTDVTLTYQSIIGQEAAIQLQENFNEKCPDKIICCVGGGSSFGGLALPFMHLYPNQNIDYIAVESQSIPKLSQGEYHYDYPGSSKQYPRIKMYTLGSDYTPPDIHSTGLRYHCSSPIISYLLHNKKIRVVALPEKEALQQTLQFSKLEGIIPAPESAYGIAQVIHEAKKNDNKSILSIITGNGFLDMSAFINYSQKNSIGKIE